MKKTFRWIIRYFVLAIPMVLCICLEHFTEWLFEKMSNAWGWTFDD